MSADINPGKLIITPKMKTLAAILTFIGFAFFTVGLIKMPERAWKAYTIGFFFFVSLGVGGLFFTAVQHATKAGWSVNVRRFCEALTAYLPAAAILAIIFYFFGTNSLYEWFHADVVAKDHLLTHKQAYLNPTFFGIRLVVFFGVWLLFTKLIVGGSLKQDETGDSDITRKLLKYSVIFLILFAFSYSLFSVDVLMSLMPHWFSTIFGVYLFAGLFQTTMAVMILMIIYLRSKNKLAGLVDENHLHDLGKFLFAFSVFWAYMAYSQYMLIWYANIPEETIFFLPRSSEGWAGWSIFLFIGKFFVPFFALLPRWAKRTPPYLAMMALWILGMHFVDLFWLVYPSFEIYAEGPPAFAPFYELGVFCGFAGIFMFTVMNFLSKHNLVPIKDPRIHESLHHHVVY